MAIDPSALAAANALPTLYAPENVNVTFMATARKPPQNDENTSCEEVPALNV